MAAHIISNNIFQNEYNIDFLKLVKIGGTLIYISVILSQFCNSAKLYEGNKYTNICLFHIYICMYVVWGVCLSVCVCCERACVKNSDISKNESLKRKYE